ncbi:MAG: radical SAM protein [Syntrophomonadaceae bacterium]|nr:radical SAM protein [Syntrophomonadaceae bacterium]
MWSEHIRKLTVGTEDVDCERFSCACLFWKRPYRPVMPADIDAHAEMMLTPMAFVVRGAKNHCIYDLKHGNLYAIDDAALEALKKGPDEELRNFLLTEGLLEDAAVPGSEPRDTPLNFAMLQTTDLCNLKCIHCYEDAIYGAKDFHTLSLADAEYAMDELRAIGVENIQFTGGEPLCNPHIIPMLKAAAARFSTVELYSNCVLMDDDVAALLKELGITVAVSIYSYDPMDHSFVTLGRNSHDKTTRGLEILNKHGVETRISTILMDGVDLGTRGDCSYDLNCKQDVVRLTGRAGAILVDESTLSRKLITPDTFKDKLNAYDVLFRMGYHNCFGYALYISAELEVNPCPMEKRLCHGDIKGRAPGLLAAIIKPELLAMNGDRIEGCRGCEYRYACFHCIADSMDRAPEEKPWYCAYEPETGVWHVEEIYKMIRKMKQQVREEILKSDE